MLELFEVNMTGAFAYGPHETIVLDGLGITELTGINLDRITQTANGCGKTNLLNTVCHVLYDKDPTGASGTDMVNHVWGKGLWNYLKYKTPQGLFRIVVTRKWSQEYPDPRFNSDPSQIHIQGNKYRGTDVYFDQWNGNMWVDRRAAKTSETRKAILASLPMSYQQFLTTSYMAQQHGNAFVTGQNKDRMQIISELTDMTIWDKAKKLASGRLAPLLVKQQWIEGQISGKNTALSSLPVPLSDDELFSLELSIAQVQDDINEANATIQILNDELVRLNKICDMAANNAAAATVYHTGCINTHANINTTIRVTQLEHMRDLANIKLPPDEQTPLLLEKRGNLSHSLQLYNHQRITINNIGSTCDKCGTAQDTKLQVARLKALADNIATCEQHIASNELEIKRISSARQSDLASLQANLMVQQSTAMSVLQAKLQAAQQDIVNAATNVRLTREAMDAAKLDTKGISDDVATHQRNIGIWSESLRLKVASRDRNEQISATRTAAQASIQADIDNLEIIKRDCLALSIVIKGMSDRGIKAHKFGAVIATLNELVKEYIDVLTDGQVQVCFTPFREKANAKDDDDVVAEVSIIVREGPKEGVELALYSGAEKQQITLAIICAFWRLASQQGGGSNILFLDEIFGSFDGPTASLAVKLIEKLRESHFGTIVVVTHDTKTKDMLDYDTHWIVTKKNHISTLESR